MNGVLELLSIQFLWWRDQTFGHFIHCQRYKVRILNGLTEAINFANNSRWNDKQLGKLFSTIYILLCIPCNHLYHTITCIAYNLTLSNALKSKSQCWRTENYYVLKWKMAIVVCACIWRTHIAIHYTFARQTTSFARAKRKQATFRMTGMLDNNNGIIQLKWQHYLENFEKFWPIFWMTRYLFQFRWTEIDSFCYFW